MVSVPPTPEPAVPSGQAALSLRKALAHFETTRPFDSKRVLMIARDVRSAMAQQPSMGDLDANGQALRFSLEKFSFGKRNQNIRSSVRALLKWVHDSEPSERRITKMSNKWLSLVKDPSLSHGERSFLSRLSKYCSRRSIEPDAVTDQTISEFIETIEKLGTVKDIRLYRRRLTNTWNTCSSTKLGWPATRLTLPPLNRAPQLTPSLEQLGETMAAQVEAIRTSLVGRDKGVVREKRFDRRLPEEGGPQKAQKKLAPITVDSYMKMVRRAIRIQSQLTGRSYDVMLASEIVDCGAAENILNTLADDLESRGKSSRNVHLMACALLCVAVRHFKVDKADEETIHWLLEQAEIPEPKMTLKNVERLRQLVLVKQLELLRLPGVLIENTLKKISQGRCRGEHLVDAQVGVAVALLLSIPVRESNLAAMRLGVHLFLPASKGGEARLLIPSGMVKNRLGIDRFVPVDVTELLRVYVIEILPRIRSNSSSNAVFPGQLDDTTRGAAGLGTHVSRRIQRYIGIEMNLHLFRHFAAVSYLEAHPGEYEVVRILLGNRNLQTVKDYYTSLEKEAALRKVDDVVRQKKVVAGLNPNNMLERRNVSKRLRR